MEKLNKLVSIVGLLCVLSTLECARIPDGVLNDYEITNKGRFCVTLTYFGMATYFLAVSGAIVTYGLQCRAISNYLSTNKRSILAESLKYSKLALAIFSPSSTIRLIGSIVLAIFVTGFVVYSTYGCFVTHLIEDKIKKDDKFMTKKQD